MVRHTRISASRHWVASDAGRQPCRGSTFGVREDLSFYLACSTRVCCGISLVADEAIVVWSRLHDESLLQRVGARRRHSVAACDSSSPTMRHPCRARRARRRVCRRAQGLSQCRDRPPNGTSPSVDRHRRAGRSPRRQRSVHSRFAQLGQGVRQRPGLRLSPQARFAAELPGRIGPG